MCCPSHRSRPFDACLVFRRHRNQSEQKLPCADRQPDALACRDLSTRLPVNASLQALTVPFVNTRAHRGTLLRARAQGNRSFREKREYYPSPSPGDSLEGRRSWLKQVRRDYRFLYDPYPPHTRFLSCAFLTTERAPPHNLSPFDLLLNLRVVQEQYRLLLGESIFSVSPTTLASSV